RALRAVGDAAGEHLHAADVARLGEHRVDAPAGAAAALGELALELGDLLLQLALVRRDAPDLVHEVAALHGGAGAAELALDVAHVAQGVEAGGGEDAADAGGDASFARDLEEADVAEGAGVGAAAELDDLGGHREHADGV